MTLSFIWWRRRPSIPPQGLCTCVKPLLEEPSNVNELNGLIFIEGGRKGMRGKEEEEGGSGRREEGKERPSLLHPLSRLFPRLPTRIFPFRFALTRFWPPFSYHKKVRGFLLLLLYTKSPKFRSSSISLGPLVDMKGSSPSTTPFLSSPFLNVSC